MLINARECQKMLENAGKCQKIQENSKNSGKYQKMFKNAKKRQKMLENGRKCKNTLDNLRKCQKKLEYGKMLENVSNVRKCLNCDVKNIQKMLVLCFLPVQSFRVFSCQEKGNKMKCHV